VVNLKIVEQRTRQEQQEGINHKDEQPKAQQHGNKGHEQQHGVERDMKDTVDRRDSQRTTKILDVKPREKFCNHHQGQRRQHPLYEKPHHSNSLQSIDIFRTPALLASCLRSSACMQQVYPNHEQTARPCTAYWLRLRQGRISPMIGATYVTVVPLNLHQGVAHAYWALCAFTGI